MKFKVLWIAGLMLAATAGQVQAAFVYNYTGGLQSFTASATGVYRIQAAGAQGASGSTDGYVGGKGALVEGDFSLTVGETLYIAVGGMGLYQSSGHNGGGGGGSFVVAASDNPLLIAGGGGGTRQGANQNGIDGQISQYGTTGSLHFSTGGGVLKTTGLGLGGLAPAASWGSGGAGFFSDGQNDQYYGTGGKSWFNGLAGGTTTSGSPDAPGGYGGGGAGNGYYGGGGGGGYSGGDGGLIGGGGGSFNAGLNQFGVIGYQSGNGFVTVELISAPVPEPASLAMWGISVIGMAFARRKRKQMKLAA